MSETQADPSAAPPVRGAGADILSRIVTTKREELGALVPRVGELSARARDRAPARDFHGALREGETVALVAEVKRRSPGAGEIRPGLDPARLAWRYAEAGASALSVLTDAGYFGGSLDDLTAVREAAPLPVLRKDFLLHEVQVWEARAREADAVLLIVRILEDGPLRELRLLAEELGMAALVEVHDERELERALASGARILGINNRDLGTFTTRLGTTLELRKRVPEELTLVSESGIRDSEDVARLAGAGIHAVLVGESLLRAEDPGAKASELAGVPRVRIPAGRGRTVEGGPA